MQAAKIDESKRAVARGGDPEAVRLDARHHGTELDSGLNGRCGALLQVQDVHPVRRLQRQDQVVVEAYQLGDSTRHVELLQVTGSSFFDVVEIEKADTGLIG
jgi:hypothetical protein